MSRRKNRGDRTDRREVAFLRSLRSPRFFLIVISLWPAVASAQPRPTFTKDIAPIVWTRCASCHRPGEIGPFSLITYDDVRPPCRADRGRDRTAPHAAVEAAARERRVSERAAPHRRRARRAAALDRGRRARGRRGLAADAAELDRRLATRHARPRRPHAGAVRRAGRRHRCVPHVRDPHSGQRARATCARSSFIPATRAWCTTRTWASIGRGRRASSTRAIPSPATPAAWSATRAIRKGSCSAGRRGRRRMRCRRAPSGASSRAATWSCSCTCSRPGKRSVVVGDRRLLLHRHAADADAGGPAARQRDDRHSRRRHRRTSSPTAISCRWTSRCWRCSRTRTTSRGGWRRPRELPDGTTRWLIAIDDWDFRWQDVYRYADAVRAAEGHDDFDALHVRQLGGQPAQSASSARARRLGPEHVGRDGRLWMQVIPRAASDEPVLTADFRRKAHAEDLAAYTKLLRMPIPPTRCATTPSRPVSRRRTARRGDRGVPRVAAAQSRVGADALQPRVRAVGARPPRRGDRGVREALRLDPDYAQAHNNLGALLQVSGQPEAALEHFRARRGAASRQRRIAHEPRSAPVESRPRGRGGAQFVEALALRSRQRAGAGRPRVDSRDGRRSGASRSGGSDPSRRARRRVDTSPDVTVLDALAAAYAPGGGTRTRFAIAKTGSRSRSSAGQVSIAAQFRQRLDLYQTGQPLRMPRH